MEKKGGGVLITAPNGEIYNIPTEDLEKFKVAPENVERTIMDAEKEGFLVAEPEMPMEPIAEEAIEVPAPQKNGIVINIFYGEEPQQVAVPVEAEPDPSVARSTMAKYAGGSTMAKYAGGSTMAKYAGGSTMAKYAGGSTMAKYAGGSTMAKYAGGSTMTNVVAEPVFSNITFYGSRWAETEDSEE